MTVCDLLAMLNDLPLEALNKAIFIDNELRKMRIEPITESCEDTTIIAYTLVEDRQLEFDFTKDVN